MSSDDDQDDDRSGGEEGVAEWRTGERESLVESPIFRIDRVRRSHPDGTAGEFYTMDLPDWVNVVARTPEGEVVLVRQYRHGTDEITLEIPGGNIDEGESPVEAGLRELREETGYVSTDDRGATEIGVVEPNPAFMGNRCYTVLVEEVRAEVEPDPDAYEEFEVLTVAPEKFVDLCRNGGIRHALVVAAAFHFREWRAGR